MKAEPVRSSFILTRQDAFRQHGNSIWNNFLGGFFHGLDRAFFRLLIHLIKYSIIVKI